MKLIVALYALPMSVLAAASVLLLLAAKTAPQEVFFSGSALVGLLGSISALGWFWEGSRS